MPDRRSERLQLTKIYRGVISDPCLTCHKMNRLDIYVNIRHASSLIFRNFEWNITEQKITTTTIRSRALECLGCENTEMPLVARDIYRKEIDVKAWLKENGNEEQRYSVNAAHFGESVFLNCGAIEMTV